MEKQQHNLKLKELARLDQLDRIKYDLEELSEKELWKHDRFRLLKTIELLETNQILTARDFVNAAIIFQHGRNERNERDLNASNMAVKMMNRAIELDASTHQWLLAAAIDRNLMIQEKPQIYGTQYIREHENAPWEFYHFDGTKISDNKRKSFSVRTIAEQESILINMNKKKLVKLYSTLKDIDLVADFCRKNITNNLEYDFSWKGISSFAFQLWRLNRRDEALKTFHLLIELYPKEYDSYHSLGALQVELGMFAEAEKSYMKSLELNPDFKTAEKDLNDLRKTTNTKDS